MVILLLVMFLNENASRCANIRGVDQPFRGGLIVAVYRISEPVRTLVGKTKRLFADYRCDCGKVFTMRCDCEGKNKSCGCARGDGARKRLITHGLSRTPTFITWAAMKNRCNSESSPSYNNYGGRGISICERWLSFENFMADMGERPDGCSIDRIDSNGNYEPSNCRWSTKQQQERNRRNNRILTIDGKSKTTVEWSEQLGAAKVTTIRERLRQGWSSSESVFGKSIFGTVAEVGTVVVATNQERKVILNDN